MEPIALPVICPHCQNLVPENSIFCPRCGKAIKATPLSTSRGKQLVIYAVSFFLAPFGLGWAFKYLKCPDQASKKIGLIALILTVLSIIINLYLVSAFFGSLFSQVSDLNLTPP